MRRLSVCLVLAVLCAAVVGVRAIGFEHVFPRDREGVVLAMDDAQYHARRAAYTFEHFPAVLSFDWFLNYPRGASVPWPPLYDFALGGAARLLGGDRGSLERVLAWAPVALALLTALAVFAAGRTLGGTGVALGAVALFAGLPATTHYSSVGNPDHHAAVAFVATLLLLGHLKSLEAAERAGRVWAWQSFLVAARVAMLLTWHGSVLYVVLAEAVALAVAVATRRREVLLGLAVSCGLSALLGFWALSLPHSQIGGPWSAVELSRLQPTAYGAFALTAGLTLAAARGLERRGVSPGVAASLASTAGIGLVLAAAVAFFAWDGLRFGWEYASHAEPYIAHNYESHPLWSDFAAARRLYAHALWLVPLAPFAGWIAARREKLRPAGLYLSGWTAALLCIAVSNARYASDFAPAVCLSLSLLGAEIGRAVTRRLPAARRLVPVAAALGVLLLLLGPILELAPHARRSLAVLQGARVVLKRPGEGLVRSVYSFVDRVREVTPDPGGVFDSRVRPSYGILSPPTLGFVMKSLGQRPTPAGNFGPYVGDEGFEASRRFYRATNEKDALLEALPLLARYVVTSDEGPGAPASMQQRLHHEDGSAAGRRDALHHFRLVAESPRKGVPLGALRGAAPDFVEKPYKLFQIVDGAVLVVAGSAPGHPVSVEVEIDTGADRRFTYRATAKASKQGFAKVRVPYANDATTPARPVGPYLVRTDSAVHRVEILERQIAGQENVYVR